MQKSEFNIKKLTTNKKFSGGFDVLRNLFGILYDKDAEK